MSEKKGLRIVADENIAAAADAFGVYGEVTLLPGRAIDREAVADADVLVVRSITKVDRTLLEGSSVRFVGTATIGRNHLDEDYLWRSGITLVDAAGAGARSVAEYAITSLLTLHRRGTIDLNGSSAGVIGVGAIGSLVSEFLQVIGLPVVEFDPPRDEADGDAFQSATIEEIHGCDVIVLAAPLKKDGDHPTYHQAGRNFFNRLKPGATLVNVARGGIVDSEALLEALRAEKVNAVLDVWEDEPEVDPELLGRCALATPHTAGYSRDGKLRGTEMMAAGIAEWSGSEAVWHPSTMLTGEAGTIEPVVGRDTLSTLGSIVAQACPIEKDDAALRALFPLPPEERRKGFDRQRKEYGVRREFSVWRLGDCSEEVARMAERLGFSREK